MKDDYAVMPGRYPAIVKSYNGARRTCRIEIPGMTEGSDVLPEAEIEYANMELLADTLMKLIAGGDVLIQSASKVTIKAPAILLDGATTVTQLLTWQAGASGIGGSSGNSISGGMTVTGGDVVVNGIGVNSHHHTAQGATAPTTAAQA